MPRRSRRSPLSAEPRFGSTFACSCAGTLLSRAWIRSAKKTQASLAKNSSSRFCGSHRGLLLLTATARFGRAMRVRLFSTGKSRRGLVSAEIGRAMRARHADYKAGKVGEDDMCGEMVTMHKGLSEDALMDAATEFMTSHFPGRVFAEMKDLVHRLHEAGCEVWAVSSSNEWVIRAGMKQFGIEADRILAGKVEVKDGIVTDRLIRLPSGPGKPQALREVCKQEH